MEYALPSNWGHGSRGFWTKRRKTATSLLAILALIAGIAVAFKLFDRTVTNNVVRDASVFHYEVLVGDRTECANGDVPTDGYCNTADGDPIFLEARATEFPGGSQTEPVRIDNLDAAEKDATFMMHVDQSSITVRRCADFGNDGRIGNDFIDDTVVDDPTDPDSGYGECRRRVGPTGTEIVNPVPANAGSPMYVEVPDDGNTSSDRSKFIKYWTLSVQRVTVDSYNDPAFGGNVKDKGDPSDDGAYEQVCSGALTSITSRSACVLGRVWAPDTVDNPVDEDPLDVREFKFTMTETDDNTDQSRFRGWTIDFGLIFQARVPALPESSEPLGSE